MIKDLDSVVDKVVQLAVDDEEFAPRVKGDLFHVLRHNQDSPYLIGYWDGDNVPAREEDEEFVAGQYFREWVNGQG